MASRIDGTGTRKDPLTDARRLKRREPSKRDHIAVMAPAGRLGCPMVESNT
jgi:hypothetical protein